MLLKPSDPVEMLEVDELRAPDELVEEREEDDVGEEVLVVVAIEVEEAVEPVEVELKLVALAGALDVNR
jgi:hypothetical protein